MHSSLAAVVVPAKSKVVHEEHDRLVLDECFNLNAAKATEVVGEVDMLQFAVLEVRARRQLDLGVIGLNVVALFGVPSRTSHVEDTWIWACIVTAKPSTMRIEPESTQAVVGTVSDVAGLRARNTCRHARLVPCNGIVRAVARG